MMGRGQKIFTTVLWGFAVTMMLALVGTGLWARRRSDVVQAKTQVPGTALSHGREGLPVLFAAPSLGGLIDQDGRTISADALRGNVWICDFVFTHCAGPCPKMTSMMADLQQRITRPDVKLVSFSVDPERDTPAVLKEYGRQYGADFRAGHSSPARGSRSCMSPMA